MLLLIVHVSVTIAFPDISNSTSITTDFDAESSMIINKHEQTTIIPNNINSNDFVFLSQ
jgi:hypothetical protein